MAEPVQGAGAAGARSLALGVLYLGSAHATGPGPLIAVDRKGATLPNLQYDAVALLALSGVMAAPQPPAANIRIWATLALAAGHADRDARRNVKCA